MKKLIYILLCTIFAFSCELFNGAADPEYLTKLHDEVAWANAPRLFVTVGFPAEWGSSPQRGEGRCGDTRFGYPFNVEFGVMPGYGFEEWLAFYTEDFDELDKSLSASEIKEFSRNDIDVFIENIPAASGSHTAKVIIKTTIDITLVPWCGDRPAVIHSNPPLIGSGFDYTRGQQIVIKFSMRLNYEDKQEIQFGANTIIISGQDLDGTIWNEDGLLIGTFYENYFENPIYNAETNTITITPKKGNEPPGDYNITIMVGTGLIGANGNGLSAPVSFSYRTSREIVTMAYKANNVWAIHETSNPHAQSFFYQMAPVERDRRLRKNGDDYEINLYFSVSRSMGEIPDRFPDTINIAQIYYADITGKLITEENAKVDEKNEKIFKKASYDFYPMEDTSNSAGLIYRQMNNTANPLGVYHYRMTYTFPEDTVAGIYRLVVLPERVDGNKVSADDWTEAVREVSFVTVVIDDMAPGFSAPDRELLRLSGENTIGGGSYNYTQESRNLTITTNFSSVSDNDGNGIPLRNATPNLPWTMDEWRNLEWMWRIIHEEEINYTSLQPLSISANPPPMDLFFQGFRADPNKFWSIEVKFIDALGYESEWKEAARIRYAEHIPATTILSWSAVYEEDNNNGRINFSWVNPPAVTGVRIEYSINGGAFLTHEANNPLSPVSSTSITNNIKPTDPSGDFDEYVFRITSFIGNNPDTDFIENKVLKNIRGMKVGFNNIGGNVRIVNNFNDALVAGTLRHALNDTQAEIIHFFKAAGETITLTSPLPQINRSLTIAGNGITLTRVQSGWTSNALMRITGNNTSVNISRVHFKDGLAANNGAAINKSGGTLNLESCIFSGNQTTDSGANGGAISNTGGDITIRGCTFYNNRAANGGAIYRSGGTLTLAGNVFNANTASNNGRVVHGTVTNNGFNVVDQAFGNADHRSDFVSTTGDRSIPSVPLIAANLKPYDFTGGAAGAITSRPTVYPTLDFYGNPIPANNAQAGAIQETTSSVTAYWIVTNFTDPADAETTQGTLRHALKNAKNGDVIALSGVTPGNTEIQLTSSLSIDENRAIENITIEGNGVTIKPVGNFRLLTKSGGNVTIRRVHFTGGRSEAGPGGAITNGGRNLTLESCIFTNNRTNGNGGAINQSSGTLTIMGCTFYDNHANWGGVITYDGGSLNIRGNLFYGNTASAGMPVVNRGVRTVYASYNVVDVSLGTSDSGALANSQSGFPALTTDRSIPSVPLIAANLNPHDFFGGAASAIPISSSRPSGYPTVDFYGVRIPVSTAYAGASQTGVTAGTTYLIVNNFNVPTSGNGSQGQLHHALSTASAGSVIAFSNVTPGTSTITISNSNILPEISKDLTIYGNGITIRGPGWNTNNFVFGNYMGEGTRTQLLRIGNSNTTNANRPTVIIERVHFRGGRTITSGAAISNYGILYLDSCIFSNNFTRHNDDWVDAHGGAIRNENNADMYVRGCTFYANAVDNSGTKTALGAAIYNTGSLTITGNIFYGNNSFKNDSHIIWGAEGLTSGGHNIVDRALGRGEFNAGYDSGGSDATTASLGYTDGHSSRLSWGSGANVSTTESGFGNDRFIYGPNPFTNNNVSGSNAFVPRGSVLQTHIWDFNWAPNHLPPTDFYGRTRVWPGAPGAVRQP